MSDVSQENVQEKIKEFQQMQQQIQALSQQISQMDMAIGENNRTLEELKNCEKDAVLYRSIGSVMKKVDDVKQLQTDLEDEKETIAIRNKALKDQLESMNKNLIKMQKNLAPVVQSMQDTNEKNASN